MRVVRSNGDASAQIHTQKEGSEKREEAMAHHKLNPEQQLKGVQAALRSPRTPPQLKDGLRRREQVLLKAIERSGKSKRKKRNSSFLKGIFG